MSDEWIPVSEQLPEHGVRCIIATRIPGRFIISGDPQDGCEIGFGEWGCSRWLSSSAPGKTQLHPSMVTHWMPLPEPPKKAISDLSREDAISVLRRMHEYLTGRIENISDSVPLPKSKSEFRKQRRSCYAVARGELRELLSDHGVSIEDGFKVN